MTPKNLVQFISPNQEQNLTKSIGYTLFARLVAVGSFPALGRSRKFSRAWQKAYVFPRLAATVRFSTLGTLAVDSLHVFASC